MHMWSDEVFFFSWLQYLTWYLFVTDEQGVTKKLKLKVKDVFNLSNELRIVVDFDEHFSPIGEAAGLLAGVCGQLAIDTVAFPISFTKWSEMPESFLNHSFDHALKVETI